MIRAIELQRLREVYVPGTRIRLVEMGGNDPMPVEPGTKGTVDLVDDAGQIQVRWDNGRSLTLVPGVDTFCVIKSFCVGYAIRGRYYADVEASSVEEAMSLAEIAFWDADFGQSEDTEGKPVSVYDDQENIIWEA